MNMNPVPSVHNDTPYASLKRTVDFRIARWFYCAILSCPLINSTLAFSCVEQTLTIMKWKPLFNDEVTSNWSYHHHFKINSGGERGYSTLGLKDTKSHLSPSGVLLPTTATLIALHIAQNEVQTVESKCNSARRNLYTQGAHHFNLRPHCKQNEMLYFVFLVYSVSIICSFR